MSGPFHSEADGELVRYLENALALVRARAAPKLATNLDDMSIGFLQQATFNLTDAAKALYRARRQRERYFDTLTGAFSEPAWDLMLDLFIAGREGRRVSVSSAAIAADVPSTTALRWIGMLEGEGIIVREADIVDRRRSWLRLGEAASLQMERYITDCVIGGMAARLNAHCLSSVAIA